MDFVLRAGRCGLELCVCKGGAVHAQHWSCFARTILELHNIVVTFGVAQYELCVCEGGAVHSSRPALCAHTTLVILIAAVFVLCHAY